MSARPPMHSTLMSRRDLDFLLFEWLRVDELTKRERFAEHSLDTFAGVLDLYEQLATRYFAPHNKTLDSHEPSFDGTTVSIIPEVKAALDAVAATDLLSVAMDHELGGSQLPTVVNMAGFAWITAANISTASYLTLTIGNANLLAKYGTPTQIEAYVKPMLAGRFAGTMCLSETQAGPRSPISPPAPNLTPTAHTGYSARRCGSPAAIISSPRTSCIWCWPRSPADPRGPKGFRCSWCPSSWSAPTGRSASATTSCWPG